MNDTSYDAYNNGLQADAFVRNADGGILWGQVWPGTTAYPDFWKQSALDWWAQEAVTWQKVLDYDGWWIDMNEVSFAWRRTHQKSRWLDLP